MNKTRAVLLIIVGAIAIVFGILMITNDIKFVDFPNCLSHVLEKEYGGDAYTGIQNAAAQTANNIYYLAAEIRIGLGAFFILAGMITMICAIPKKDKSGVNLNSRFSEQDKYSSELPEL